MSSHRHSVSISGKSAYTSTVTNPDLSPYLQTANLEAALLLTKTIVNLTSRIQALENPVTPPPPPPTTPAFLSYPTSAPINHVGDHDVEVTALSFVGITGTRPALRFEGVHNIHVHDVDFADFPALGSPAILCLSCTGTVIIENVRGRECGRNLVQFDKTIASGRISGCKVKGGTGFEDVVSMYASGGTTSSDLFQIVDNQIDVEDWTSGSGSGMMLADTGGGHILAARNRLLTPGQVGIGISGGTDVHVTDNVIYGAQRAGSNVGIYTPYTAGSPNPGGHEVARNRIFWLGPTGTPNPIWDGGASGTIAGWSTNVLQDTTIDPASLVVVL